MTDAYYAAIALKTRLERFLYASLPLRRYGMKDEKTLELCPECAETIGVALRLVERGGTERIKCVNCRKQRWGRRYAVKEVKHG